MEEIKDVSEYNWIEEQLEKWPENPKEEGFKVWHAIPKGFPAYCEIFPPLYLDLDYADDVRTWEDIRENSKELEFLYARKSFPAFNFRAQRILWEELANQHGIEFSAHISEEDLWKSSIPIRYVSSGEFGEVSVETTNRLSTLISTILGSREYFLSYIDGMDLNHFHRRIFKGTFPLETNIVMYSGTQAYWWGVNKDWCFAVDYDTDFIFFGGSEKFVDLLIKDKTIECLRVEINTKI